MCMKEWFSRAQIMHCFGCHCAAYLSQVLLFMHVERMSSNQCPFFTVWKKKKHLGLTHTMTNRDKRAHINIHCLVPEQLRLLNDSDNKNSMSCLCYGERSNGSSGLRDMGIISFVLDCHRRDLRLTSGHWSLLTAQGHEHYHYANYNQSMQETVQKQEPHNHTSRIGLASRCHEPAAISSQSPLNCTAARHNQADLHHT